MTIRVFFVALGLALLSGRSAAGQHEGHQGASSTIDAAQAAQCGQAKEVVNGLVEAAIKRIEAARLTNNAAAMRDAVDDVETALLDIKQQLTPCGQLAASAAAAGQAGRAMPGAQQTPAGAPGPLARPGSPAPHDAHAEHAPAAPSAAPTPPAAQGPGLMPAPPTDIASLKCRTQVDPKTAPRMLHQGRMYYFCSEQERSVFAKDPSKYAVPAGQAAPAHAH
jgi:YHS domain-containing protein